MLKFPTTSSCFELLFCCRMNLGSVICVTQCCVMLPCNTGIPQYWGNTDQISNSVCMDASWTCYTSMLPADTYYCITCSLESISWNPGLLWNICLGETLLVHVLLLCSFLMVLDLWHEALFHSLSLVAVLQLHTRFQHSLQFTHSLN